MHRRSILARLGSGEGIGSRSVGSGYVYGRDGRPQAIGVLNGARDWRGRNKHHLPRPHLALSRASWVMTRFRWPVYLGRVSPTRHKPMSRSRVGLSGTVLFCALLGSAVSSAPAAAHQSPLGPRGSAPSARIAAVHDCGVRNFWFDGYQRAYNQGTNEGAFANISARDGAFCATVGSDTNYGSVWAMIAGADTQGYVQSGLFHRYGGCVLVFGQVRQNDSYSPRSKFGTSCISTDGTVRGFGEQYGPGCGCEYAKIDGNVWMTTSWDPYAYWAAPFAPIFMGEQQFRESDMPGDAASPTDFTKLQGQHMSDDAFYDFGCNLLQKRNDWLANRSDGQSWYDRITVCPSFTIYTDVAGK